MNVIYNAQFIFHTVFLHYMIIFLIITIIQLMNNIYINDIMTIT